MIREPKKKRKRGLNPTILSCFKDMDAMMVNIVTGYKYLVFQENIGAELKSSLKTCVMIAGKMKEKSIAGIHLVIFLTHWVPSLSRKFTKKKVIKIIVMDKIVSVIYL
jgi:hypothetical protein